jgi:hypothetical protein
MSYNGWTNSETWVVNLWCEQEIYNMAKDVLSENLDDYDLDEESGADEYIRDTRETIKEYFEECVDNSGIDGVFRDLLPLQKIDWHEIAEYHCEDLWEEAVKEHNENKEDDNEQD